MGVYVALLLVTVGALSHANRVPYLGGDIVDFISESKSPDLTDPAQAWIVSQQKPIEPKPITAKQKRDSSNYNTKFNDIARAYAEGYKAAIKAVQQRAIIARRRLQTIRSPYLPQTTFAYPRSFIPGPNPYALSPLSPLDARIPKSTIPQAPVPDVIPVAAPEPASAAPQAKDIISPAPVSDHETQTLPTIGGDFPDTKAAKEEMVSRSVIPAPASSPKTEQATPSMPDTEAKKKDITPSAPGAAQVVTEEVAPKPAQATENAVEKSAIPSAPASPSDIALEIKERSTKMEMPRKFNLLREDHPAFPKSSVHLRTMEERSKIAKMNARARHRNIYFDSSGGDPFNGGGVLSRQNAVSLDKKHKKRRRRRRYVEEEHRGHSKHLRRHRRSHMPYLGQNLDALGIVRATPKSWTSPQVRKSLEAKRTSFQAPPGPFAYFHPPEFGPSPFSQAMPPAFRGEIPQPPPNIAALMGPPPMPQMSYGQMFPGPGPGPGAGPPPPQFPGYRNMIPPGYPAFYGQMPGPMGYPFQSPLPAGLVNEEAPSIETLINKAEEVREKKSAIPVPEDHQDRQDHQAFDMGRGFRYRGFRGPWK